MPPEATGFSMRPSVWMGRLTSSGPMKSICELAERLHVKNLVLYHTEDKNIARRQELYRAEGETYFTGNLLIPEDMDVIEL